MAERDDFNEEPRYNDRGEPDQYREPNPSSEPIRASEPAPAPEPERASEPVSAPKEDSTSMTSKASSALSSATDSISNGFSSAKDSMTNFFGSVSASSVFIGAVIAAIIAMIVAYILYRVISANVSNRVGAVIAETKVPIVGTSYVQGAGDVIPAAGNGTRMTINFWIYVNDIDKYRGLYRHVFHRGDKSLNGASPTVFFDNNLNVLYVRFESTNTNSHNAPITSLSTPYSQTSGTASTAFNSSTNSADYFQSSGKQPTSSTTSAVQVNPNIQADLLTRGISIDYIPLQRWVFVSVVVNEDVNMGSITAYLDGELVKTVTSDQTVVLNGMLFSSSISPSPTTNTDNTLYYNFQNLMLNKGGDVWVGGNPLDASIGPGFSGLVASISFYNYDMNAKDIYDVYMNGPIDNVLAKMGLPAYGVRSPVYRIG